MFQKEVRSVEVKVVENKLQQFVSQAFSKNSQRHAFVMAVWGAIMGGAAPYILMWQQGQPMPNWKVVIGGVLIGAFSIWSGYSGKNGAMGSSGSTAVIKPSSNS